MNCFVLLLALVAVGNASPLLEAEANINKKGLSFELNLGLGKIGESMKNAADKGREVVGGIAGGIKNGVAEVVDHVGNVASNVGGAIGSGLEKVAEGIRGNSESVDNAENNDETLVSDPSANAENNDETLVSDPSANAENNDETLVSDPSANAESNDASVVFYPGANDVNNDGAEGSEGIDIGNIGVVQEGNQADVNLNQ